MWDGRVEDGCLFCVAAGVCPLVAQALAGFFGLGERDDFLEGKAEEVAEPEHLLEPDDVGLAVEALCALGVLDAGCEQSELLVVADRPRRDSDLLRNLADPEGSILRLRGHAASSTDPGLFGAPAAMVSSTWWYLPPRRSEAPAATRHAAIANTNA